MTISTRISPPRSSQHQRGATLLLALLFVVLGLATLVTLRADRRGPEMAAERKTALALAQAKEALLGNSATNGIATTSDQNPGRLPCPDTDNDGDAEGLSCASKYVGRFPWKTLDVGDLRDAAAERLWYVVDLAFFDDGSAMNSAMMPTLAVNGNPVVAVIVAPGSALAGQQRDTANQNNLASYLESYVNATTINLNQPSAIYNDRILTITARELFTVVTQRMVREFVKKPEVNVSPYPSSQPLPPPPSTSPDVWFDNQWNTVATYFPTPSTNATQFTLQFTNCASLFTVTRSGTSNIITRDVGC